MKIETLYSIGEKVMVRDIETRGIIRSIRVESKNLYYQVSYWWDGKLQEVWLYQDELESAGQ